MRTKKLIKDACEVCGERNSKILHLHHIVPRTDPDSTNAPQNLAILCPNCHAEHHAGTLTVVGTVPSTRPPNGRTLVFDRGALRNVPGLSDEEVARHRPSPPRQKIR